MDLLENKHDDLPDDSDSDDADFVPEDHEPSDAEEETESTKKSRKGKRRGKRGGGSSDEEDLEDYKDDSKPEITPGEKVLSEEDEKKKTDLLYSAFLSGVDTGSTAAVPAVPLGSSSSESVGTSNGSSLSETASSSSTIPNKGDTQKTNGVANSSTAPRPMFNIKKSILSSCPAQLGLDSKPGAKRGGLSSILNAIQSKKKKLTTLEQSKADWQNFKKAEGIEDELRTVVKDKNSYVEKQQFLQRADLRQFEIEKGLRAQQRRSGL